MLAIMRAFAECTISANGIVQTERRSQCRVLNEDKFTHSLHFLISSIGDIEFACLASLEIGLYKMPLRYALGVACLGE
jgi:hypothetical protein